MGSPPSYAFTTTGLSGRPLNLRQWWPEGSQLENLPEKGAAVLLVPGLGAQSQWGGGMVRRLIDDNPLIYGLDTAALTETEGRGHLENRKDLVTELRDAVACLAQKHGGPVYVVSISLGAITAVHLAADPPESLGGVVLMAPAFRPSRASFSPRFYFETLTRFVAERLSLRPPKPQAMPYEDAAALLPQDDWTRGATACLSSLSTHSFIQLGRMLFLEGFAKARKIQVPVLMMVPSEDTVCSPEAMRKGFRKIPAADKTLVEFPQTRHNMIFEPSMPQAAQTIREWLALQKAKG